MEQYQHLQQMKKIHCIMVLMTTYASLTERPSNVTIHNNTFKNHERGISVFRSYEALKVDITLCFEIMRLRILLVE